MRNTLFIVLFLFPLLAQSQVTDHEGRTYKTVKIGNQTWMAENLNVITFRNGDTIPAAYDEEEWILGGVFELPARMDIAFDEENGQFFGKLYNYLAISDQRGIAPDGWRVPTDEDWKILAEALGGPAAATSKLKSAEGWMENGTNESGFEGYPLGMIDEHGYYDGLGFSGYWWSSTRESEDLVINRNLAENKFPFEKALSSPYNGLSLRLVKID